MPQGAMSSGVNLGSITLFKWRLCLCFLLTANKQKTKSVIILFHIGEYLGNAKVNTTKPHAGSLCLFVKPTSRRRRSHKNFGLRQNQRFNAGKVTFVRKKYLANRQTRTTRLRILLDIRQHHQNERRSGHWRSPRRIISRFRNREPF